ncbi:MAG: hypothetical protein P8X51_10880 [Maritimibacter sp.]|jgi:hypothetical protein
MAIASKGVRSTHEGIRKAPVPSPPFEGVDPRWLICFFTTQPIDVIYLQEPRVKALNLTLKSLSILKGNAVTLAKLTLPVFVIFTILSVVIANNSNTGWVTTIFPDPFVEETQTPMTGRQLVFILLANSLHLLAMAFMAVLVHRYVLLEDTSYVRAFTKRTYGRYILRALAMTVALAGIIIVLVIPAGLFGASIGETSSTRIFMSVSLVMITSFLVALLAVRWGLVLPAASVGKLMKLEESWKLTRGFTAAIAIATGLTWTVPLALSELVGHLIPIELLAWAAQTLISWPVMLFGVVILTVLYGHRVEGRPLDT